jgi:hypothetical protein
MPAYMALSDHQFLNENNMMAVPYSPLLAPWDFFLFPKLKIRGYNGDFKISHRWCWAQCITSERQ